MNGYVYAGAIVVLLFRGDGVLMIGILDSDRIRLSWIWMNEWNGFCMWCWLLIYCDGGYGRRKTDGRLWIRLSVSGRQQPDAYTWQIVLAGNVLKDSTPHCTLPRQQPPQPQGSVSGGKSQPAEKCTDSGQSKYEKLHIISAVRNSFFRGGRSQHNIHRMSQLVAHGHRQRRRRTFSITIDDSIEIDGIISFILPHAPTQSKYCHHEVLRYLCYWRSCGLLFECWGILLV